MAQHDYVIANGTGAAVRSDLNNGLAAIVSQNSGSSAPATTYAYMTWADTTAGVMKMRNGANNAWITLYQLDGEWSTIAFENGSAAAPSIYFKDSGTDTGIYSPGTDQVAISTGGTGRLFVDSSGRVGLGTSVPGTKLEVNGDILSAGRGTSFGYKLPDCRVFNPSSGAIFAIDDYANTRFLIDSSGRVGIGTASPDGNLTIGGLTNTGGQSVDAINVNRTDGVRLFGVKWDVTSNEVRFSGNTKNYVFRNGSSEAETARIDSSGRLLVGTSTASGSAILQVAGDLAFNSGYGSVAVAYGCRAWVNFNGTGTVAIRGSGNVSSITDNGTGDYTVNFTTAMVDANYAAVGSAGRGAAGTGGRQLATNSGTNPTTSACRITTTDSAGSPMDLDYTSVAIFR
jgi:hypothetical protein